MKTFGYSVAGALLGIAVCSAAVGIFNALGMTPNFPAFGGEDDFSLRTTWFLVAVMPGFMLIGGWLGTRTTRTFLAGAFGVVGVLAGTLIYCSALLLLRPIIEALPNQEIANASAILAQLGWLSLSAVGGVLGAKFGSARAARE